MGSTLSSQSEISRRQYLIGRLEKKSSVEKKFFGITDSVTVLTASELSAYESTVTTKDTKITDLDNEVPNEGEKLFTPLAITKSLYCTETYINWRAHNDLEKMQMRFLPKKDKIYLIPVGDFPEFINEFSLTIHNTQHSLFNLIKSFLGIFYCGMSVDWLDAIDPERWNITSRYHSKTEKKQYLVSDFYPHLKKYQPKNSYCIMGMIWTDLYPKESMNFVLGEASKAHRSGLFSFGRFEPKSYNKDTSRDITHIDSDILWKLLKVSSHELGHLFGMGHCDFFLCGMNGSSSVQEALDQPLFFCPVCIRKLQHVCKFDIIDRYQQMRTFFLGLNIAMPSDKFRQSVQWLEDCLAFLDDHSRTKLNK